MLTKTHLVLFFLADTCSGFRKNACNTFYDYFNVAQNKNCFYNSDMDLEVPDLITKYTGNVEEHIVTTEDGYILTMFRIPRRTPRDVILLQHSLLVDSRVWVGQGNNSLAFYLWQMGYEVWVSNTRGTSYSQRHETLLLSNHRYWNFSFHEIGVYDVSCQVKHIKKVSASKIIYLGHSQGSASGLIYGSMKSDEALECIKLFVFMSTPCFYTHITSPLRLFTPLETLLRTIVETFNLGNALFFVPIFQISRILFRFFPVSLLMLNMIISFILGWTPQQADPAVVNFDFGVYFKDFSWKILLHYLQLVKSKTRFQLFDYGSVNNLKYYNSKKPPRYPLEKISVPVFFVSSYQDSLTSLQDSELLATTLKNIYGHLKVKGLNHFDFHFGRNKKSIYFEKLVQELSRL